MLDNNENDLKLLKMVEKLLEVSDDNQEENLEKYANLAKQIDSVNYNSVFDKLYNESNEHNLSLEEELVFLEDIEKEYEQLNELQCRFRNVYERYALTNLELSDLDNIDIDAIRDRKNLISGYLVNLKNIENYKNKLKKCNEDLILEDRKRISIEKRLVGLEEDLKRSFVNSEGRVYSRSSASIVSTSVVSEYRDNGIDLQALLDNNDLLKVMLKDANEVRKEKEEVLSTAELCYDRMPTKESKEILDSIKLESVKSGYKLSLLKMIALVSKVEISCDGARFKRENLLDLIKYRSDCLEELGIKFSVDPFSRIKISEQLKFLNEINDNSKVILRIRKEINDITDGLDELERKNTEFIMDLNRDIKFVKSNLSMSEIDISGVEDEVLNPFDALVVEERKEILPNQVDGVKDTSDKFMHERVFEKTTGVIKRVNEMMGNSAKLSYEDNDEVIPELVVEGVTKNSDFEKPEVVGETVEPVREDDVIHVEEGPKLQTLDDALEDLVTKKADDKLFQDVVPFESVQLFNDKFDNDESDSLSFEQLKQIKERNIDNLELKYDKEEDNENDTFEPVLELFSDNVFVENRNDELSDVDSLNESGLIIDGGDLQEVIDSENILDEDTLEPELPDAFWPIQEGDVDSSLNDNNIISFDEQVNNLLANENGYTKVRGRAA